MVFCEDCNHNMVFCEDRDHDRSPNYEDCGHDRSHIKTQKHDIFVRIAIMVAILTIRTATIIAVLMKTQKHDIFEDYDHGRDPNCEDGMVTRRRRDLPVCRLC